MLPNASVVPEINKQRKNGKRHQREGFCRKSIIHPPLLLLLVMIVMCHVLGTHQDKRHIVASSYLLGGSTGNQDARLGCPAMDKRPQTQFVSPASRYLEIRFQNICPGAISSPWRQPNLSRTRPWATQSVVHLCWVRVGPKGSKGPFGLSRIGDATTLPHDISGTRSSDVICSSWDIKVWVFRYYFAEHPRWAITPKERSATKALL